MGGGGSKSIKVASLNYSGITHSPFEFYPKNVRQGGPYEFDDDNDFEGGGESLGLLSQYFEQMTSIEVMKPQNARIGFAFFDKKFKWGVGNFDKNMHRERYSPLYRKDVGVVNSRFMNRKEFVDRWWKEFDKNKKYVRCDEKDLNAEAQRCVVYDYLIFKTFTEYCYHKVYRKMSIHEPGMWRLQPATPFLEDRVHDLDADDRESKKRRRLVIKRYNDFMDWFFSKPYLSHRQKFRALREILQTHDVTLLQDASDQAINDVKNDHRFTLYQSPQENTCIIVRDEKFKIPYSMDKVFTTKEIQEATKNMKRESFLYNIKFDKKKDKWKKKENSCVCLVDDFLFVSVHLSKTDDESQVKKVIEHINNLSQEYPNLNIVIGGDFLSNNVSIQWENERAHGIDCFPRNDSTPTTIKKRTSLQSQNDKTNDVDKKCRDYILTNMTIKESYLLVRGGALEEGDYLPNTNHLFDHAIVSVTLTRK